MTPAGLILFPGAGGNRDSETLLALEEGLGLPVRRLNFAYRDENPGPRPPPRVDTLVLEVDAAVGQAAREWGCETSRILVGGRSMGGRVCSMAVAAGLESAGLVLLSYPLYPQRKPEKLRIDHLEDITAPVLLVQGTRDPMGRRELFDRYLGLIPGAVTQVWLDGANHSPKGRDPEIVAAVDAWIRELAGH